MGKNSKCSKAAALRDFFASVDAGDLKRSASDIARCFGLELDPATDWTEVEYDFNRLFVGPAAVPAPPYASAWQEGRGEPTLMGSPALEARRAYARLGLAVPDQGSTPDDHLAFELDAAAALEALATDPDTNPDADTDADGPAEVRAWLIDEHMGTWIPRFAEAVRGQQGVSAPVSMAVDALVSWLDHAGEQAREQARTRSRTQAGAAGN